MDRTIRAPYFHYIRTPTDSAFLFIAVMIQRLYLDSKLSSRVKCFPDTPKEHPVRNCAIGIIHDYEKYLNENPEADHIELAFELLRLHSQHG